MLLYIDGFDSYPTADIPKRWVNPAASTGWTVQSSSGRNSTGCLQVTSSSSKYLLRALGNDYTTPIFVGCAFNISALPTSGDPVIIFSFVDNGVAFTNNLQVIVGIDNAGNISIGKYSGATFTSLGTYAASIQTGFWYYLEIQAKSATSTSSGDLKVYLNGVLIITLGSGLNTNSQASGKINTLLLGSPRTVAPTTITVKWDDLYIADSTGSLNTGVLGDVRIESLRPTGEGSNTDFTPSTGSNYENIDDDAQDGDSTYNSASTTDDIDTYIMGDLVSTPASIKGIQVNMIARKDDAGTRILGSVIRTEDTNYDHGTDNPFGLADSYTTKCDIWEQNPNGPTAWTGTTVNALEAGVKLIS